MPIAEVLLADIGEADVHVADWDRIFSCELRIYDRTGAKVAEIVSDMQHITLLDLEFTLLQNGGCGAFSFVLGEEYTNITIGYNYRIEICFYSQPNPWFTGFVTVVPKKGTSPTYRYAGFGYFRQLDFIRVNEIEVEGQDVAAIVQDIYNAYLLPPITDIVWDAAKVDSPIYTTLGKHRWERIAARTCLQLLAELGSDAAAVYEFGVDAERDFYFRAVDTTIREKFWIGKHLTTFEPVEDESRLANRLYVRCGRYTDATDYVLSVRDGPGAGTSEALYGLREDMIRAPEIWPIFSDINLAAGIVAPDLDADPNGTNINNMTDEDYETYWESDADQAAGDFIEVDLGSVYDRIAMVVLDSEFVQIEEYYARGFDIRISTTGAFAGEETVVFTTDENSILKAIIAFVPTQGQFVRITLTVAHTEEWKVGEFEVYELDTSDVQRWAEYILSQRKDIQKRATAVIKGVDKIISQRATLGPITPRGIFGIYDEDGDHIDDYAAKVCKYHLTPKTFDLTMELGDLAESIPKELRKLLALQKEVDMSGVRDAGDFGGGLGIQPLIITSTMLGKEIVDPPQLRKGVWQEVHDEVLTANETQVDILNLDGDVDHIYYIICRIIGNKNVNEFHLRPNGDTTANAYRRQWISAKGNVVAADRPAANAVGMWLGSAEIDKVCMFRAVLYARQGAVRTLLHDSLNEQTAGHAGNWYSVAQLWNVGGNITWLRLWASQADGIKAGSHISIYKIPSYA